MFKDKELYRRTTELESSTVRVDLSSKGRVYALSEKVRSTNEAVSVKFVNLGKEIDDLRHTNRCQQAQIDELVLQVTLLRDYFKLKVSKEPRLENV